MSVELEELRRYEVRLQEVIDGFPSQGVRIPALEGIPPVSQATELQQVINELVQARSELRVLQDRYSDDFPPVQEVLTRIATLEGSTIPRVANSLVRE